MIPRAPVRLLAVAQPRSSRRRSSSGAAGRSTAPPGRTSRHGAATMDTLISRRHARRLGLVGRRAVLPRRRRPGHADELRLIPDAGRAAEEIYFEVAAVVTTFILAGRYFEARAKRRAGAALRALLELGAKEVAVLEPRRPSADPGRASSRSATASSSAPARRSPPTASSSRAVGRRPVAADRRERAGRGRPGRRGHRRDRQRRRPARRPRHPGRRRDRARADRAGS